MKATRLTEEIKEKIKGDNTLLGMIADALDKSTASILYRWLPQDNEQLTLPRIQAIIKNYLGLEESETIIEEYENTPA